VGFEIERKYRVADESWRAAVDRCRDFAQGYLANGEACSVRVRLAGDLAWLTVKSASVGMTRLEFEYPIPAEDADRMLSSLCGGSVIRKTRSEVSFAGKLWEIDEFHGENAGLVTAEIELSSEDDAFQCPPWLGEEVTADARYSNASLATHPWCHWGGTSSDRA